MSTLARGREFDLIRAFLAQAQSQHPGVQVGPGDDCAIIPPFAISTDMSVEDVHFRRAWLEPEEIGYRAAAAALSDLAAVAARPVAALVSFAFTSDDADAWAVCVMRGATAAIESVDAVLAGGDVTRATSGAVIDVVVIGEAQRPILRSGAKPGDEIWVTGELGGAAAAVAAWRAGQTPSAAARASFAQPAPRIAAARWLAQHANVTAMIDISDGIAGDAQHLAAASSCAIVIDAALLPVHAAATLQQARRRRGLRAVLQRATGRGRCHTRKLRNGNRSAIDASGQCEQRTRRRHRECRSPRWLRPFR